MNFKTLIAWLVVATASWAATPPASPVPPYTLVRVKLEPGEKATVLADGFMPVEVVRAESEIVWTGPPGRYGVLVITESGIEAFPVVIQGSAPPRPNPGPNPGPDPEPPPGPVDVPNEMGVGQVAYDNAIVADQAGIKNLINIYESAGSKLAGLSSDNEVALIERATDWVDEQTHSRVQMSKWWRWADLTGNAMKASFVGGNDTKLDVVEMYTEIGAALRLRLRK